MTIVGVAAIAWGAMLAPASAEDSNVTDAEETTTTTVPASSTTSTTAVPVTTTSSTSTTSTTVVPTTTTTLPLTPGDPDNDGASNEPHVDFFDDGAFADQDPTIAVLNANNDDSVVVYLDVENNEQLRKVTWNGTRQAGNIAMPNGYVSFEVVNLSGPVDVVSIWDDKNPKAHALYKGAGTSFAPFATTETHFEGGVSIFEHRIVDGGAGDADKAVNGTIVDPIGPGFVNLVASNTTTTLRATIARTGSDTTLPAFSGFAAVLLGVILLAIAWKPRGGHYLFDRA